MAVAGAVEAEAGPVDWAPYELEEVGVVVDGLAGDPASRATEPKLIAAGCRRSGGVP
jgi:hypothetical protein